MRLRLRLRLMGLSWGVLAAPVLSAYANRAESREPRPHRWPR